MGCETFNASALPQVLWHLQTDAKRLKCSLNWRDTGFNTSKIFFFSGIRVHCSNVVCMSLDNMPSFDIYIKTKRKVHVFTPGVIFTLVEAEISAPYSTLRKTRAHLRSGRHVASTLHFPCERAEVNLIESGRCDATPHERRSPWLGERWTFNQETNALRLV